MWFTFDTRTGGARIPVDPKAASWSVSLGRGAEVRATLPTDADDSLNHLWNVTSEGKRCLGVDLGGRLVTGVLWQPDYQQDAAELDVVAQDLRTLFDRVLVMPVAALTLPTDQWFLPNPAAEESGQPDFIPNPAVVSAWAGLDLGTVAKRLVQQHMAWPGGSLPIVFQADRAGSAAESWLAAEMTTVAEAFDDISSRDNGPEIQFTPRWAADGRSVEWVMETGTETAPLITTGGRRPSWDLTAPDAPVRKVRLASSGANLGSIQWVTGGRSSGEALIARAYSSRLTDLGFPLMHRVDSSRSQEPHQWKLDTYARRGLDAGAAPRRTWSFEVKADEAPLLGSYWVGDFVRLRADGPEGFADYEMRVTGLSGSIDSDWVQVSCDPGRRV